MRRPPKSRTPTASTIPMRADARRLRATGSRATPSSPMPPKARAKPKASPAPTRKVPTAKRQPRACQGRDPMRNARAAGWSVSAFATSPPCSMRESAAVRRRETPTTGKRRSSAMRTPSWKSAPSRMAAWNTACTPSCARNTTPAAAASCGACRTARPRSRAALPSSWTACPSRCGVTPRRPTASVRMWARTRRLRWNPRTSSCARPMVT